MIVPNTSGWISHGVSGNSAYFEIEPEILAAVPTRGVFDDAASARQNVAFQNAYWRQRGHGGVVVIFFDGLAGQDKDARRIYQTEPDRQLMRGSALVGGSLLGRAMGAFFLGMSRPQIPLKMFGGLEPALAWARELNQAAAATTTPEIRP